MQPRRRKFPVTLLILAALGAGAVFLLLKEVPAPQGPVEQKLDSQPFLKH